MEDDDLTAIRNKRMQELQKQMKGGDGDERKRQQMESSKRQEDMVNSMLSQLLNQDARARLNSIALVKPDQAKQVEGMLINMARSGQISEKMTEKQLVQVLEQISEKKQRTTVKFERRRVMDSDSDE